eukprot:1340858-Rhodomonas_salina.2
MEIQVSLERLESLPIVQSSSPARPPDMEGDSDSDSDSDKQAETEGVAGPRIFSEIGRWQIEKSVWNGNGLEFRHRD